jgi:hypothetical protein
MATIAPPPHLFVRQPSVARNPTIEQAVQEVATVGDNQAVNWLFQCFGVAAISRHLTTRQVHGDGRLIQGLRARCGLDQRC